MLVGLWRDGRPEAVADASPFRADSPADRLPATAWHRHSTGRGTKGPRHYDRAWIGIGHDSHRHPLVR
ncbi:hypothetical protein ACFZC6_02505 [Streptomyces ossamyceticus]|uniref:hypothetical protein n=1 Tax=Streptomyces ossamyceticus TaxID=249581 RepID=UPI0036E61D43